MGMPRLSYQVLPIIFPLWRKELLNAVFFFFCIPNLDAVYLALHWWHIDSVFIMSNTELFLAATSFFSLSLSLFFCVPFFCHDGLASVYVRDIARSVIPYLPFPAICQPSTIYSEDIVLVSCIRQWFTRVFLLYWSHKGPSEFWQISS